MMEISHNSTRKLAIKCGFWNTCRRWYCRSKLKIMCVLLWRRVFKPRNKGRTSSADECNLSMIFSHLAENHAQNTPIRWWCATVISRLGILNQLQYSQRANTCSKSVTCSNIRTMLKSVVLMLLLLTLSRCLPAGPTSAVLSHLQISNNSYEKCRLWAIYLV